MPNSVYGNLDDIFLFCTVVREGSLSKAAVKLGLPASTVSRRISALEVRMGAPLLVIGRRELVPTQVGKRFYEEVGEAMGRMGKRVQDFREDRNAVSGHVRIVMPEYLCERLQLEVLSKIMRDLPAVTFDLTASDAAGMGDGDIVVCTPQADAPAFEVTEIECGNDGIYAGVGLLPEGAGIGFEALSETAWIGSAMQESFLFQNEAGEVSRLDVEPRMVVATPAKRAFACELGLGLAVLPQFAARGREGLVRVMPEISVPGKKLALVSAKVCPRAVRETRNMIAAWLASFAG